MPKTTVPLFALLFHLSYSLDCYDHTSKFSIPCEELVWFEECYALYNKSADGSWKMEDAGCSGKKMKAHVARIKADEGFTVKLSPDRKALYHILPNGTALVNCMEAFCNLPERINPRLDKEVEEEPTTTAKPTEVPMKIKEDVIERLLSGKMQPKKAFEVTNELGVNTHRQTRPLIFNAPDRRRIR